MEFTSVRNREGHVIPFDQSRITAAILKAFSVTQEGDERDAKKVSDRVLRELYKLYAADHILNIEEIQDAVKMILQDKGLSKVVCSKGKAGIGE